MTRKRGRVSSSTPPAHLLRFTTRTTPTPHQGGRPMARVPDTATTSRPRSGKHSAELLRLVELRAAA